MHSNTNINPVNTNNPKDLITKHIKINDKIICKIKRLDQHHSNININPIKIIQS